MSDCFKGLRRERRKGGVGGRGRREGKGQAGLGGGRAPRGRDPLGFGAKLIRVSPFDLLH